MSPFPLLLLELICHLTCHRLAGEPAGSSRRPLVNSNPDRGESTDSESPNAGRLLQLDALLPAKVLFRARRLPPRRPGGSSTRLVAPLVPVVLVPNRHVPRTTETARFVPPPAGPAGTVELPHTGLPPKSISASPFWRWSATMGPGKGPPTWNVCVLAQGVVLTCRQTC